MTDEPQIQVVRMARVVPFDAEAEFGELDKNAATEDDLPSSMDALMYANRYTTSQKRTSCGVAF